MSERRFGPTASGERGLAVVLLCAAVFFLYFFWVHSPYFPAIHTGGKYAFLAAGVCLAAAIASWRWKRFQSEIVLSAHGVEFQATGGAPVARTALAWADLAALELVIETRPRDADLHHLVFIAGPDAAEPGQRYSIICEGLEAKLPVVMEAILATAREQGFAIEGPRPQHVGSWFNGMNWRLEPAKPGPNSNEPSGPEFDQA